MLKLENHDLKGKTAVVTGSGRGMGEAFARILALNGAKVAVCDMNGAAASSVAKSIGLAGGAAAHQVDVSDPAQVAKLMSSRTSI